MGSVADTTNTDTHLPCTPCTFSGDKNVWVMTNGLDY